MDTGMDVQDMSADTGYGTQIWKSEEIKWNSISRNS